AVVPASTSAPVNVPTWGGPGKVNVAPITGPAPLKPIITVPVSVVFEKVAERSVHAKLPVVPPETVRVQGGPDEPPPGLLEPSELLPQARSASSADARMTFLTTPPLVPARMPPRYHESGSGDSGTSNPASGRLAPAPSAKAAASHPGTFLARPPSVHGVARD